MKQFIIFYLSMLHKKEMLCFSCKWKTYSMEIEDSF